MANQTIIQAAGQRYAPTKIDYSGYIQGIASITTALIEKEKKRAKNAQSNYDLLEKSLKSETVSPYKNYIKETTYEMVKNGENPANLLEGVNSDLDDYDELMKIVSNPNVKFSGGENSLIANYLYSLGDDVFENSITIKSKDENGEPVDTKLNITTWLDPEDNRFKMMNVDGTGYITVSEILAMAKNATKTTDGVAVKKIATDFSTSKLGDEDVFVSKRDGSLTEMTDLFEFGVLNKQGEVLISPEKVKLSAMIDQKYPTRTDMNGKVYGGQGSEAPNWNDGTKQVDVTFYDWYLASPDKFPPDSDFQQQWVAFQEKYPQNHKDYERMKKLLVASMIEEDGNVEEDFLEFYGEVLNTYRQPGSIK
tara:strand:- start:923 stop:2017 length:1095 start_codon:yes stop_codon:yes gene_type:complete